MLEQKISEIQNANDKKIVEMKEEIINYYKSESKYAVNTLLEERNQYLKELEEKDKHIRELNYKIYKYEEKLEKAEEKKGRFNILAPFYQKNIEEEEQPVYTSQILNCVY